MILNGLRRNGWELRKIQSVQERRKLESEQADLDSWRILQRYPVNTILDIGANTGQFARIARHWHHDACIVSFEPLADCFAQLSSLSAQLGNHRAVNSALGQETGSCTINRNESTPSSSLLKMESLHSDELPQTSRSWEEEIQVDRLDDVAAKLQFEGPFFVKLDVQGFEREVLLGGQETVKRAHALVMEVSLYSLYEGAPTFDQLYTIMKDLGFDYKGNVDQWVSQRDRRILQCDCLFENTSLVTGDR